MVFAQQARLVRHGQVDKALVVRVFAAQRGARSYFHLVAVRVEVHQQVLCTALVKVHPFGDMRVAQNAGQFLAHRSGADPADARLRQGITQRLRGGVGEEKYVQHDVGVQHPKWALRGIGECWWQAQLSARGARAGFRIGPCLAFFHTPSHQIKLE